MLPVVSEETYAEHMTRTIENLKEAKIIDDSFAERLTRAFHSPEYNGSEPLLEVLALKLQEEGIVGEILGFGCVREEEPVIGSVDIPLSSFLIYSRNDSDLNSNATAELKKIWKAGKEQLRQQLDRHLVVYRAPREPITICFFVILGLAAIGTGAVGIYMAEVNSAAIKVLESKVESQDGMLVEVKKLAELVNKELEATRDIIHVNRVIASEKVVVSEMINHIVGR